MTRLIARIRILVAAAAVLMIAGLVAPVSAQQVNPTAESVNEQQLLRELNKAQGRGTIPDTKSYVLEQPRGREWREFHEVTLKWIGGIAILGILGVLVVFLTIRGRVRIEGGRSGRTLVRYNAFERLVHWMTATCFVILALSGLDITFGKELLLPYLGPETFAAWSQWAKYAHNYLSFPFTLGVVLILLMWIAWNFPTRVDIEWLRAGGGIVGHEHPPARRFNAGQKMIYWIVVLGGGAVAASGYLLMFPFYATDIAGMQLAQVVHGVVAVLFVAAMLGSISARSAWKAPSRRWAVARSMSTGRSSTTACGSPTRRPRGKSRAAPHRRPDTCSQRSRGRPHANRVPAAIVRHAHHWPRGLQRLGQDHAPWQGDPAPDRAWAHRVDAQARAS
jgi:formate dehydrogenase subunit gamma